MGKKHNKSEPVKRTTVFDFLIALGSGFVNLLKIEKIICLIVLYLIGRDIYFVTKIDKGTEYSGRIIDYKVIIGLLQEDSTTFILFVIIACLLFILMFMICTVRFIYVKEINRLTKERSEMMHDVSLGKFHSLKEHNSSDSLNRD